MATKKTGRTAAAPTTPELPTLDDLSKWAERFKLPGVDVNVRIEPSPSFIAAPWAGPWRRQLF